MLYNYTDIVTQNCENNANDNDRIQNAIGAVRLWAQPRKYVSASICPLSKLSCNVLRRSMSLYIRLFSPRIGLLPLAKSSFRILAAPI